MTNQHKHTVRLQLTANPGTDARKFQILFIGAGEANGWTFSEAVLTESAALWDQCSVFVDHSMWGGRSVRDLAGVLDNCAFDSELNGLVADLTAAGPSKEILLEAAQVMMQESSAHPDMGFSADLIFTADAQNNVQKIMQPLSVDLVMDPAFATKFIRQLNRKVERSEDGAESARKVFMTTPAAPPVTRSTLSVEQEAARDLAAANELIVAQSAMSEEAKAARLVRIEMGNNLIDTSLAASDLPASAQKAVHKLFHDKAFAPADLRDAIQTWKDTLAEANAGVDIVGPARFSSMFNSGDMLQAAIDDLVGAPRDPQSEKLQVAKFTGIKEAYISMTGDREFVGGFFKDRIQFQSNTASFPGLLANALNKALIREWGSLGKAGYDWWTKIATVEHFNSLQDISWLIFGTAGSLPTVAEGAEYTEIRVGDGKETSSFVKKGGYVGLTLEALDKDDTRKLRAIPRELANAGLREISALVAAVFTDASGAGPTMADTGALFNSTAVTTKGGHANLLTTVMGTDYVAWNAIALAMYNQPMLTYNDTGGYGLGKKMAIEPKYCLVPRALKAQADTLFVPRWASQVQQAPVLGGPSWGGMVEVVTVPEWTDITDFAAVADPNIVPAIMVGERFGLIPQIFVAGSETDPAMFSNDESRIKVRHFIAVGVADFRPLHKENVAG